jgi:SAM-dependent methyltransferase
MHDTQVEFCRNTKNKFPEYFENKNVLDVGSLDINGNNKGLFDNCNYSGLDIEGGNNVDIVSYCHLYDGSDNLYDTIISTNCFEHDMYYKESFKNIIRLLKPGGFFIFSCASLTHHEHGTMKSKPQDSPFTTKIEGWKDYYKNLSEFDVREVIDLDTVFSQYEIRDIIHSENFADLQFWGIKK